MLWRTNHFHNVDYAMLFPGDLKGDGFELMSRTQRCTPNLFTPQYYCVSHHGSLNGHPDVPFVVVLFLFVWATIRLRLFSWDEMELTRVYMNIIPLYHFGETD